MSRDNHQRADFRRERTRARLRAHAAAPRLCVKRSLRYLYAQVIDDAQGRTIASASTRELGEGFCRKNKAWAEKLGALIAERTQTRGVKRVVFDRGERRYHGKLRSLAEAARKGGLEF